MVVLYRIRQFFRDDVPVPKPYIDLMYGRPLQLFGPEITVAVRLWSEVISKEAKASPVGWQALLSVEIPLIFCEFSLFQAPL